MSWLDGQPKETRRALVIGNGAYDEAGTLTSPPQDAQAMKLALEDCYFNVRTGIDLTTEQLLAAFDAFVDDLADADVGLLYYSGHGVQVGGDNYLVPTDGALRQWKDLTSFPSLPELMARMSARAGKCIVILDACRNEPAALSFGSSIAETKTLAMAGAEKRLPEVAADLSQDHAQAWGPDNYIAFATAPGTVAYDGRGGLSPFTEGVLRHITTRGLDIDELMTRSRNYVASLSQRHPQTVWINSALRSQFFFKGLSYVPALVFAMLGVLVALVAYATDQLEDVSSQYGALSFAAILGYALWHFVPERGRSFFGQGRSGAMILVFAFLALLTALYAHKKIADPLIQAIAKGDPEYSKLFKEIEDRRKAVSDFNLKTTSEGRRSPTLRANRDELQKLKGALRDAEKRKNNLELEKPGVSAIWIRIWNVGVFSFLVWIACALCLESFDTLRIWVAGFAIYILVAILPGLSAILSIHLSFLAAFIGVGFALSQHVVRSPQTILRTGPERATKVRLRDLEFGRIALFAVVGAVSGVLCSLITHLPEVLLPAERVPLIRFLGISDFPELVWAGVIFGAAMALAVRLLGHADLKTALVTFVAIMLGWQLAQGVAIDLGVAMGNLEEERFAIFVAGAVGAAITGLGLLMSCRPQQAIVPILVMIVLGAELTFPWAVFKDMVPDDVPYQHLLLFVPWQAGIAASIGATMLYLNPRSQTG